MDRRFVFGLMVSLLFVVLWINVISPWLFPRPPKPPQDPAAASRPSETRPESRAAQTTSRPAATADLVRLVRLENKNLRLTFSTAGATLVRAELLDYHPNPYSLNPDQPPKAPLDLLKHWQDPADPAAPRLPKAFEMRDVRATATDPTASLEGNAWRVEASDDRSVTFVIEPGTDKFASPYRVKKRVWLPDTGRHAEVELTLEYLQDGSIVKACRFTVTGGVSLDSDVSGTHDLAGAQSFIFQKDPEEGDRLAHKMPANVEAKPNEETREQIAFNGSRRFVADINNYFGIYCALVQMPPRMTASFVGIVDPAEKTQKPRVSRTRVDLDFELSAEKDKPANHKMLVYFGPNEARFIEADLEKSHPEWVPEFSRIYGEALGMFAWIGRAVLFLLAAFNKLAGNWGVAIMLLTFFVRLVLFPLNRRSQILMVRHSEAMTRIKPKLDVLKEKYKNDTKRFLAEQTALLKAEKVPLVPLGGCLPLLLQIPIFYGLFNALRASIELRQAPFLWALDLSQPDHLVRFEHAYSNPMTWIPCCCVPGGMSDTISGIHLLPILMTAAWFFNQLLMPKPATEDPQMAQQRKMMMFLPLLMGFMMYGYGAGLSLYWLTSSLLGIIESRVIKKGLPQRQVKTA
jgi:YidC/Oxa1 family membrane protein insertase